MPQAASEYEPAAGGTAGPRHETQSAPQEVASRPLGALAGEVVRARWPCYETPVDRRGTRVPTSHGPSLLGISAAEFRCLPLPVPALRHLPAPTPGRARAPPRKRPAPQVATPPSHPSAGAAPDERQGCSAGEDS